VVNELCFKYDVKQGNMDVGKFVKINDDETKEQLLSSIESDYKYVHMVWKQF